MPRANSTPRPRRPPHPGSVEDLRIQTLVAMGAAPGAARALNDRMHDVDGRYPTAALQREADAILVLA